jgi:DNA mismatch endonuclease (patch repair protein)
MQRVRRARTKPELLFEELARALGYRFRRNVQSLQGSPDFANKRRRKVVFVHGCFWHYHQQCGRGRIPRRNRGFWESKLLSNVERDRRKVRELREAGYDVLVVWECEIRSSAALRRKVRKFWERPSRG